MIASSYESVKDRSNMELNKQRIDKTYELDSSRAIIAQPMNLVACIFCLYWLAFETIAWILIQLERDISLQIEEMQHMILVMMKW